MQKKSIDFNEAVRIAGDLYGNLLGREADKAGFDSIVDALNSGSKTPKDCVLEMLQSEEFREVFLMNNTPNEAAKVLRTSLLKELRPTPSNIKEMAIKLLEADWRNVISEVLEDPKYKKAFGDFKIPSIKY